MLQQLATQLQEAGNRPINYDNQIPFLVLMSFLFTGWIVYSGIVADVLWYLDIAPSQAATSFESSIQINGYTFDQQINPDWYYTQGYGYPQ